jgi:hypothetical protein
MRRNIMSKHRSRNDDQSIVVCQSNKPPIIQSLSSAPEFMDLEIEQIVGGGIEIIPYPRQQGKKGLVVAVTEHGIARGLEQNRWGLVGTFVVMRQQANRKLPQGLDSETANTVVEQLDTSYGYLDTSCGVLLACTNGIGFTSSRAKGCDEFERQGGKWNPDLHFTCIPERHEMTFLNWLIQRHARGIVAHCFSEPWPGACSIELQFGTTDEDRRLLSECRKFYHDSFDEEGCLRKEITQRPPANRQETSPA